MLALPLLAAACTHQAPTTDETGGPVTPIGFGCVGNADEVVDDPLDPMAPTACRVGELAGVAVGGRAVPGVMMVERGAICRHTQAAYVIDLAPAVASRLYGRYQSEPNYTPLRDSPACPAPQAGPAPPVAFGGETAQLEVTTTATIPATGATGQPYLFSATIRGRLVDIRNGHVLWDDTCRTDTSELQAAATFPDIENLRRILAGEADRCVARFATALGAPAPL